MFLEGLKCCFGYENKVWKVESKLVRVDKIFYFELKNCFSYVYFILFIYLLVFIKFFLKVLI